MKHILPLLCLILTPIALLSQTQEILSPDIRTVQVVAGYDWMGLPLMDLTGSNNTINISFDDLTHEYRRYSYTIEHCEADWQPSDGLFRSDYLDGIGDNLTIEDYQESFNTATLYNHYTLTIPNKDCRLTMSGNYRLTVFDEDNGNTPVLRLSFMVLERRMGVGLEMVTNTDIDFNHSHQQVNVKVQYNGVNVINPERQLRVVVMQNNRWDTHVVLPRATAVNTDGAYWTHCRPLIFNGGNEYRKFEFLDLHRNSMGVAMTDFRDGQYHVWLNTDEPRRNYVYDEDANGAFYIRNTDNYNNDTESEYFIAHFTYRAPEPIDGDIYVSGRFTNEKLTEDYRMEYDEALHLYHCAVTLKMGYYNYQYLLQRPDGTVVNLPLEGNFFQTANQYSALVYYRPQGGRTDLLYGAR